MMNDRIDIEESVLIRKSRLSHVEVERKVEYYYCNEIELGSLRSTGFIQNISLSFGVGVLFFGIPLLLGISSIQLDGKSNSSASLLVGCLSIFVAAIFLAITWLLNNQGDDLISNLKNSESKHIR